MVVGQAIYSSIMMAVATLPVSPRNRSPKNQHSHSHSSQPHRSACHPSSRSPHRQVIWLACTQQTQNTNLKSSEMSETSGMINGSDQRHDAFFSDASLSFVAETPVFRHQHQGAVDAHCPITETESGVYDDAEDGIRKHSVPEKHDSRWVRSNVHAYIHLHDHIFM
jgi:hypothetical protein